MLALEKVLWYLKKVSQHTKGNNLCYLFIILLLRGLLLRFIWECPSRSLLFFFLFFYAEPFDIFMYCTGSLFMRCSYIVTQILIYLLYFFYLHIFRVKMLREVPYTTEEAERAAGMGSYTLTSTKPLLPVNEDEEMTNTERVESAGT